MATKHWLSLPGAQVEQIVVGEDDMTLVLASYFILVSLTGSAEQTKWQQAGELKIEHPEIEGPLPDGPCSVRTADILDNGFVFRDEAELPLDSRGEVGCVLQFEELEGKLHVTGDRIRLVPTTEQRYIEHVRPD